jgi:hypothetical protein
MLMLQYVDLFASLWVKTTGIDNYGITYRYWMNNQHMKQSPFENWVCTN